MSVRYSGEFAAETHLVDRAATATDGRWLARRGVADRGDTAQLGATKELAGALLGRPPAADSAHNLITATGH